MYCPLVTSSLVWAAALGPAALAAAGFAHGSGRSCARFAQIAAATSLAAALAAAAAVATYGVLRTPAADAAGIGCSLYLDALSVAVLALFSFVGLAVIAFSRNFLEGDPGQARFMRLLSLTTAALLLLAISGNLLQFALAWVATSLALHGLLLFYPNRRYAALAARKKFIASRLGDLCLIAALVLTFRAFGTLEYAALFQRAILLHGALAVPVPAQAAAILFALAALLKSAQFPAHGWLTEAMETPTPALALLHAGVINAGGFLLLRLSSLITLSLPSLGLLALAGAVTAIFGSVVMLAQTSVKAKLAYSTIAQTGFMLLECGLGAFAAALLHLAAHALYRTYAFLSSGSVNDIERASWTPGRGLRPVWQFVAVAAAVAAAPLLGSLFGATPAEQPGVFALGSVLMLGIVPLLTTGAGERPNAYVLIRTLLAALAVGATYFALQAGMQRLFAASLPAAQALRGPFAISVACLVVAAFAIVTFLQGVVSEDGVMERRPGLYAALWNGLYVNTFANRLILRFWPPRSAASSQS